MIAAQKPKFVVMMSGLAEERFLSLGHGRGGTTAADTRNQHGIQTNIPALYRKLLSMKQLAPAVLRLSQSLLASLRGSGPICAA
jgi:hypothetical protein